MTEKVYIVTDLGPGDGGKGGVVHKIATMMHAHTIVKVGGAQGQHGVRTARGESFAFSQWGCGTFEGVRTHLSPRMTISPEGLLNEGDHLRYEQGVDNPFSLLTIDERALCATPYHGIASRLKELARGHNPRGTIGTGVGEANRYREMFPELAIYARDLGRSDLRDRLVAVRYQIARDLAIIIQQGFLKDDLDEAERDANLLDCDDFLDYVTKRFWEVSQRAKIVDPEYLTREILSKDGVAVVESSHGVLTDHYQGFHPHTSAIRTLPSFTRKMLEEAGYRGQIVSIGVTRAYQIRHGAGPMPTDDPRMVESLLPGSHKETNRYQGQVRVGPLDLVLLRYAISACGGPKAFDGLAVTWFDQIQANQVWHVCNNYQDVKDDPMFIDTGDIKVRIGCDDVQLTHQEYLGRRLVCCQPEINSFSIGNQKLYELCAEIMRNGLSVPVRMVSFGPTERDKVCR